MQTTKTRKAAVRAASAETLAIDTKWFKGVLADRQINQREVAATLNMDPAAVSLLLRGKRRMQLDEAAELARLLGVPLDDVLFHAGIDPEAGSKDTVPLVGTVDETGEVHMKRPAEGPRRIQAPLGMPDNCVALRVVGLGTMDGWLLYYVPVEGVGLDAVGRLCVVALAGKGPRVLRVVKRGYERGRWNLVGFGGGSGIESVGVVSASPVLWLRA